MQRETDMTDNLQVNFQQLDLGVQRFMNEQLRKRQLRSDLSEEQKAEALRIGRMEFKSAGATRKK
jgi:hypothetical protein